MEGYSLSPSGERAIQHVGLQQAMHIAWNLKNTCFNMCLRKLPETL